MLSMRAKGMSICGRKLCGALLLAGVALFAHATPQGRRFVHPGIAESAEDIARARKMITERREPWYGCFKALEKCWSANPNQKVPVYPTRLRPIDCNRTIGNAGRRAHDLALMYRLTDDERYAAKAAEFINANSHYEELDERGSGPLDYGKIYLLVEAAELLRFYKGWAKEDKVRFAKMLRDKFYPLLKDGDPSRFGNQGLFALRGALAIAVFIHDEKSYDRIWRYLNALPLRADQEPFPSGPPIVPDWPETRDEFQITRQLKGRRDDIPNYGYAEQLRYYIYQNGQCQESSRDQAHTVVGLSQLVAIAELFWIQGDDLYGALDNRILLGLEWSFRYNEGDWQPSGYTDDEREATYDNGLFYRAKHRSGRWVSLKPNPSKMPFFGGPGAPRECAYAHYRHVKRLPPEKMKHLRAAILRENRNSGGFETWGFPPNWFYEWSGWGTLMKRR